MPKSGGGEARGSSPRPLSPPQSQPPIDISQSESPSSSILVVVLPGSRSISRIAKARGRISLKNVFSADRCTTAHSSAPSFSSKIGLLSITVLAFKKKKQAI